jgi:hypothetical protein
LQGQLAHRGRWLLTPICIILHHSTRPTFPLQSARRNDARPQITKWVQKAKALFLLGDLGKLEVIQSLLNSRLRLTPLVHWYIPSTCPKISVVANCEYTFFLVHRWSSFAVLYNISALVPYTLPTVTIPLIHLWSCIIRSS